MTTARSDGTEGSASRGEIRIVFAGLMIVDRKSVV